MAISAVSSMKGGVGTTLAALSCCDKAGYKTLVVDLDPQLQPQRITWRKRDSVK